VVAEALAAAKEEVVVYLLEAAVEVAGMYFLEVPEHTVRRRGNTRLQASVGR